MATFGKRLKDFALSADIISDQSFERIAQHTVTYLNKKLSPIEQIIIAVQYVKEGKPGLFGAWPKVNGPDTYWEHNIYNDDGTYYGHSSYVLVNNKPGWFVTREKNILNQSTDYVDLLGNYPIELGDRNESIPKFAAALGEEFKTSIIIPLRNEGSIYGIINFEFKEYIEPNEEWIKEFNLLAEAFQILYQCRKIYSMQCSATESIISTLGESNPQISIGTPFVVLFSPQDGCTDVKAEVQDVLDRYDNHFEVRNWQYAQNPGNIMQFVRENALKATLAVVYLSQEKDTRGEFVDNPNTLYEAGLLDGIKETQTTPLKAVILIREENSGTIPFDLQGNRIITVVRIGTDLKLNRDRLKNDLHNQLQAIEVNWQSKN